MSVNLTAAVPLAAAAVAAVLGALNARRAAFDRVMTVLAMISEGPVAEARHELGTIWFRGSGRPEKFRVPEEQQSQRIQDLFTVFWAARRIDAIRQSMRTTGSVYGPSKLLERSVADWIRYWCEPLDAASRWNTRLAAVIQFTGAKVDDVDCHHLWSLYVKWFEVDRSVTATWIREGGRRSDEPAVTPSGLRDLS